MNWPLFLLGAAAGGFINGLAGFGTALFALGFWLQVMPPVQAVAIVLVISVATGLQGLWQVRHTIEQSPVDLRAVRERVDEKQQYARSICFWHRLILL